MIIGVGIDIVAVKRMERLLKKSYSDNFLKRVFTEVELQYAGEGRLKAQRLAARWALKEAFYKALPREIQHLSSWRSIELGGAKLYKNIVICSEELREALSVSGDFAVHHSISHEELYAVAKVVLERL